MYSYITFIIRFIFTSFSFCGMTIEVVIVFPRNRIKNNPDKTGTYKIYKILYYILYVYEHYFKNQ